MTNKRYEHICIFKRGLECQTAEDKTVDEKNLGNINLSLNITKGCKTDRLMERHAATGI